MVNKCTTITVKNWVSNSNYLVKYNHNKQMSASLRYVFQVQSRNNEHKIKLIFLSLFF